MMDALRSAAAQQQHQALSLCVNFTLDAITLANISAVSKQASADVQAHVQLHLASLLATAASTGLQIISENKKLQRERKPDETGMESVTQPFEWLLATAGPAAVAAPTVAHKLLHLCQDMCHHLQHAVADLAFRFGMQLSAEHLVAASKERLRGMEAWIEAADKHLGYCDPGTANQATTLHFIVWICGKHARWSKADKLFSKMTTEQMRDLLVVSVNLMSPSWQADHILYHCFDHHRLLYAISSSTSSSSGANSSNTDGSSGCSNGVAQLVADLLTTAIIREHSCAYVLAETPAAQQLGPQAITELLCLCIQLEQLQEPLDLSEDPDEQDLTKRESPYFDAVLALPGAQALQPQSLATLLRGHLHFVQRLIDAVPAAQQLPSRTLCEVLLRVGAAGRRQLLRQLAGLQSAQQLVPGDACWLLQQLLRSSWGEGMYEVLEDLDDMQLGGQLTGAEVLQLLHAAVDSQDGGAVGDIARLRPAAHQIADVKGYAAFLQAAMTARVEDDVLHRAALSLPITQQLPASTVLDFMRQGAEGKVDVYGFLLELPAVSSFSTATIEELLLAYVQCARQPMEATRPLVAMAALLRAPAAAQLSVGTVTVLLQHAVQERHRGRKHTVFGFQGELQELLLALPAVQQLPADSVESILTAAVDVCNEAGVSSIVELPGARLLSQQTVAALKTAALQAGQLSVFNLLLRLQHRQGVRCEDARLPKSSEDVLMMLKAMVTAGASEEIIEMCKTLPDDAATDPSSAGGVQRLLLYALQQLHAGRISAAAAEHVFRVGAVKALSPVAVAELLEQCMLHCLIAGIQRVGQLPAAAHISQDRAQLLVTEAMQVYRSSTAVQLLCAVLQLPAVQSLQAPAAAALLATGFEWKLPQETLLQLRSQLPAARQGALGRDGLRQLLLLSFEEQCWEMFDWLRGLPGAPLDDADVALCCQVRGWQLQGRRQD